MPSVSVVYKNNPNFRVVHVDPELQAIIDYEQWYMNLVMATGTAGLRSSNHLQNHHSHHNLNLFTVNCGVE